MAVITSTIGRIVVSDRMRGILYMCLSVSLWALIETIGRYLAGHYNAVQIVWARYATHLIFMALAFAPRHGIWFVRTRRPVLQIVRGLLMLLMPLFFIGGFLTMPAANVLAVFWVAPLITVGLSLLLLRERVSSAQWIMALLGWVGVAIIIQPVWQLSPAILLPIGMALCFSFYIILTCMLRGEPALTKLFYTASCVMIPLSLVVPFLWRTPSVLAGLVMVVIGLLGYGFWFTLDKALDLASPVQLAPSIYLQPIAGIVFGALLFGDSINRHMLLGTAVIIAIMIWLFLGERKRQESDTAEHSPNEVGRKSNTIL